MAQQKTNVTFKNATIDFEDEEITITETTKDSENTYSLTKILEKFKGIEGITLQIGNAVDLEPIED